MWCHGPLSLFFCNDMYICTISRHRRWKLQNTCPSGKLLACTGYWRALLLHHGHRNKIVGMGVHKVLLLVVPQDGGPAQGERSRGTIQPYKKSHPGTQASPTCPLMASYSDILLAHPTILSSVWKDSWLCDVPKGCLHLHLLRYALKFYVVHGICHSSVKL